jgi:biopolymer transport protein ExbD
MSGETVGCRWDVSDLRTRYAPATQFGQGLISTAPWVNLALIIVFFLLLPMNFVLLTGISIELPESDPLAGAPYGLSAVILTQPGERRGIKREVVFFNDQPFDTANSVDRSALARSLQEAAATAHEGTLTIIADREVKHGTVTMLYTQALKAGFKLVHTATRTKNASP